MSRTACTRTRSATTTQASDDTSRATQLGSAPVLTLTSMYWTTRSAGMILSAYWPRQRFNVTETETTNLSIQIPVATNSVRSHMKNLISTIGSRDTVLILAETRPADIFLSAVRDTMSFSDNRNEKHLKSGWPAANPCPTFRTQRRALTAIRRRSLNLAVGEEKL